MSTKPKQETNQPPAMGIGPRRPMFEGSGAKVKDRRGVMLRLWTYLRKYRVALMGIVLLVAVNTSLALLGPFLLGRAIDQYIAKGDLHGLLRIAGLMITVYLIAAAGMWVQSICMIRIAQRTVLDLRRDLFDHLQSLSLRFFDRHPHGELMSHVTNDIDTISNTMGDGVTQFISSVLSVTGAGIIMFIMNWRLALVTMVTLPLVFTATRFIANHTRQGFRDRQQAMGTLNGIIEESIMGQRVIKAYCREQQALDKFSTANTDLKKVAIRAGICVGMMGPFMNLFRNTGLAVIAGAGGYMVATGLATLGTVAAMINYSDHFNRPMYQLAALYGTIQSALAGAERVFAVMDEKPEITDAPDALPLTNIQGEVEFDNVCFSYNEDTPVLRNVSFHAKPGQTIALVGSTGAGKTTIINLLTRFYDIDSGAIRIDGKDIRTLQRASLLKTLGIVLQDTFLFTGTVRENIRYGRPEATDEEVESAAQLANAGHFIHHLPQGYDTLLSDAGSNLSHGQRQLLAIARTLLADPAILILDEATSSVDTCTEIHIQQAMHRLMQGRTSFIIAHRLNTIQRADCILVMQNGRIVERGTHNDLITQQGPYQNLYDCQYNVGVES